MQPQLGQHLVAGLAHQLGARIVVLVHAVPEAHQAEVVVLVLGAVDEVADARDVADLLQHVQRGLVGAAVRRSPQAGDARGDAGERVGARGAGQPHRRGGGVLLVIGVQDQDAVQRPHQHRVRLVLLARGAEHHVQEVLHVAEAVARIHERLAHVVLVGHGRDGRDLGQQADGGDLAVLRVVDVERVVVERRQRARPRRP